MNYWVYSLPSGAKDCNRTSMNHLLSAWRLPPSLEPDFIISFPIKTAITYHNTVCISNFKTHPSHIVGFTNTYIIYIIYTVHIAVTKIPRCSFPRIGWRDTPESPKQTAMVTETVMITQWSKVQPIFRPNYYDVSMLCSNFEHNLAWCGDVSRPAIPYFGAMKIQKSQLFWVWTTGYQDDLTHGQTRTWSVRRSR